MKQAANMFVITVWRVKFDDAGKYTVQYPPLERDVKECSGVAELSRICKKASDRYAGKEDTIVTSGFVMIYDSEADEPKVRGLKQFWAKDPFMTKKGQQ